MLECSPFLADTLSQLFKKHSFVHFRWCIQYFDYTLFLLAIIPSQLQYGSLEGVHYVILSGVELLLGKICLGLSFSGVIKGIKCFIKSDINIWVKYTYMYICKSIYIYIYVCVFEYSPTFPFAEEALHFKWRFWKFGYNFWASTKVSSFH